MNRKGQALVEFVLILPIIILILFSIVDFGVIFNKKNELENISVDIVSLLNNDEDIDSVKSLYPNLSIEIEEDGKYSKIIVSEKVHIITPGLNLVLGNDYDVKVERNIPNVET